MEIIPSVHAVRLLGATGFLIAEDELTLIDAGLRGSGRLLRAYLARIGRAQRELARIVCTHGHPDHIGGVRELEAAAARLRRAASPAAEAARSPRASSSTGVEVLIHPADMERLKVGVREVLARPSIGPLVALLTRGPEDARPLRDGDVLPVLDGLEVVHTPGHTPGSVCLYAPRHRLLFVGDLLQVIRGRLSLPSRLFSDDRALARRSIARLAELDVETICLAHYPTWRVRARDALRELADPAPVRPPSPAETVDGDAGTGRPHGSPGEAS